MKNDKKYYSPTEYQKYRNASKALNSRENSENSYSVHDDEYFYRQIQAENSRHLQRQSGNKPEQPKPPVNIKPKEEKHYSVYDEIAARRKREKAEKPMDGLTPLKPLTPITTVKPEKTVTSATVEKKLFSQTPVTEEETEAFIDRVSKIADYDEVTQDKQFYTQADIEEICEYYRKKYSRKMWAVLIISLFFFCVLLGGMYLYTGGYFENLL